MPTDIDTGSETDDQWYYIWANGDTDETGLAAGKGVFSTSASAPTDVTSYALLGAVRNDGSNDFVKYTRDANFVLYDEPFIATETASVGSWTALDLSDYIPISISSTVLLGISHDAGGFGSNMGVWVRPTGATWGTEESEMLTYTGHSNYQGGLGNDEGTGGQGVIMTDSNGSIDYRTNQGSGDFAISVLGYWENLSR